MRDIYTFEDNFKKYNAVSSKCVIKGAIDNPEISIFIPTFKRTQTIVETIRSALDQFGNVNYEIVIVNNDPEGCKGDTRNLIESFHDKRIYYFINEINIGLCGNWNRGLELCRARYVAMIHDDDMLSPWFLSSMMEALQKNENPVIIGVNSLNFDSKNKPQFNKPKKLYYREVSKKSFFYGKYITIAGMTVNRELAISIGGYSEDFYPNEDTIFIYQALLKGRVFNIDNNLAAYRQEVNLSLKDGMMNKIISYMEHTRRSIASHERFAEKWMNMFDKEYLYSYIRGANKHWGTTVDAKDIFREFGFSEQTPSEIKMKIMALLLRIVRH